MSDPNPHIVVEAGSFSAALSGVCSVVRTRDTIPILHNILLARNRDQIQLTATDLDKEVRFDCEPVSFEGDFEITVDAKRLQSVFQNLPSGAQAKLTITENKRLSIISNRNRFQLLTLPADDMPVMKFEADCCLLRFRASALLDALSRLSHAQSVGDARSQYDGIYMHEDAKGSAVSFAATDGCRIAVVSGIEADRQGSVPGVIWPSGLVNIIPRLWSKIGDNETIEVMVRENRLRLNIGSWQVTSKVIDADFPDYERIIPDYGERKIQVDCEALATAAKQVMLVNSEKTPKIRCSFEKDKLSLLMQDQNGGTAEAELPLSYSGDAISIGLNPRLLIDMANAVPGGSAKLQIGDDPMDHTLWESLIADSGFTGVLMPLRWTG